MDTEMATAESAGDAAPGASSPPAIAPPQLTKEERDAMHRSVMQLLTEEQLNRYEAFRRSSLARRNMKRLQQTIVGQQVNLNMTIVMCGIAKVFVGDLIETARVVAEKRGDKGALQVHHIQEAYQQLDREGKIPHRTANKPLLR